MAVAGDDQDARIKDLLQAEDVSCLVADALRQLGIGGVAGIPGRFPPGRISRAWGPAFTVRYERASDAGQVADRDGTADTTKRPPRASAPRAATLC